MTDVSTNANANSNGPNAGRGGGGGRGPGRNPGRGGARRANQSSGDDGTDPAPTNSQSAGTGNRRPPNAANAKRTPGNPRTAAVVDDNSRPSSAEGSRGPSNRTSNQPNRSNTNGNRGGGAGGGGNGGSQRGRARPPGNAGQPNPATGPTPASAANGTGAALPLLQRMITDLKSYPNANSPATATGPAPGSQPASANTAPLSSTSTLPLNAPIFQPGAQVHPVLSATVESARQRKGVAIGSGPPNQNASPSFQSPPFQSPLNTFSPHLGGLQEQEEDRDDDEDGDIIVNSSPPNQQGPGSRAIAQSNMGQFTAPRFAAQASQPVMDDSMANSGRPQLAPGFMFGRNRNATGGVNPISGIGEDDIGFQFPQASQQAALQADLAHRRTASEMAGVSPLMAEQIAIQSQIEALQQQQQQLLQQQIATNSVMASFNGPPQAGRGVGAAHRRIQSQQATMGGQGFQNYPPMGGFGLGGGVGLGLGSANDPNKAAHNRRHSVNVINKAAEQGGPAAGLYSVSQNDGFDDGFMPGGHSRQVSRADPGWRMGGAPQGPGYGAEGLAQAQAQLASLAQFRAAAGGHHQKMPSFSLPNMLPNMMAANMMGYGPNLYQQQQQFQMQLQQQQTQGPQRKSLFAPYLPQASLPPLLAAGKLVVGILRVNKRNRSDAYVATEVLDSDIYICGSKDRNRALEGDIVAVELLDVDDVWGTKKEKEEKKRKKEENAAYDHRAITGRKNDKKKDDVEVEGQGLMLFEDEEVTDEIKPQFAGHVVAVVERMPGQLFSGQLGLLRPSSAATKEKQEAERRERNGGEEEPAKPMERPKIVWFKPTDKRVPLIAIPTEQAPPDFVNNSEAYADRLFVACIKRHPISSLHPFGTLVEELGPIGDVEVETSALLKDCNFPTEEFTDNVIKCVPPVPFQIPDREIDVRRDLRSERIFTVDPSGARDLDDALSITTKEDGTIEVGIHIADVSHFVKPNTALDRDARKRATSVYLVQRAVPMLPPTLCEELCSLVPNQDRLAFSMIVTMNEDGIILDKWFGKTIIKSAAKLSYGDAQHVIEGNSLGSVEVSPEHQASAIVKDILELERLATKLRQRRIANGNLSIDETKLKFVLDENGTPVDCGPETSSDANKLVEEFMLLANLSVAQTIAYQLPEQALLRRHQEPLERRLTAFAERCARTGIAMDISSAGAIQRSLLGIQDPPTRSMFEALLRKAMQTASYFCAGMLDIAKYGHYALNEPLYTHFTSPIRRYADILVHRQLESVLATPGPTNEPRFNMDRDAVAKIAQQCNIKRRNAQLAQEQSAHLFLCLLISDLTQRYGPVIRQAKVVGVLDAAFDVLVPEFGIEKRVHVDQMPIDNHVYEEHSHTLQLYWSDRDVISWLAENSDDEHLKKVKKNAEQHAAKMEVNSLSVHDENALFDEDDDEDEVVLNRTSDQKKLEKLETSKQRLYSAAKTAPVFEGLRRTAVGQNIQDVRELMSVPVIVTADLTKSPPVLKVYSVNPYAVKA